MRTARTSWANYNRNYPMKLMHTRATKLIQFQCNFELPSRPYVNVTYQQVKQCTNKSNDPIANGKAGTHNHDKQSKQVDTERIQGEVKGSSKAKSVGTKNKIVRENKSPKATNIYSVLGR